MGLLKRSTVLFTQSWSLLRRNPTLAVFPVLSGLAQLVLLASFVGTMVASGTFDEVVKSLATEGERHRHQAVVINHAVVWPMVFGFYVVTFFVQNFFSTALVGAALAQFSGRAATLGSGLSLAMSRLPQILGWTLLSATVGTILQMIAERLGVVGQVVIRLLGFGWAVATYFVVPVLAAEGVGPVTAVKRSVEVLKGRWGESLVLNVGMSAVLTMGSGLILAGIIMLSFAAYYALQSIVPLGIGLVLAAAVVMVTLLLGATVRGVIQAALYSFAKDGSTPAGFDQEALSAAFRPRGK